MSEHPTEPAAIADAEGLRPVTAGAMLQRARKEAGLTIDIVAAHLKLHPKQVQAIEDDEFALLPGRTFVRGFVRNYARLMRLDPDAVVAALPGAATAPALDSPTLHSTANRMGELPTDSKPKASWTRWAIPLVLLAIAAVAGVYEYLASEGHLPGFARTGPAPATAVTSAGSTTAATPSATSPPEPATTLATPPVATPPLPASAPGTTPGAAAATTPAATPPPGTGTLIAPVVTPVDTTTPALVLALRASSWVEVKDGSGRTVIAQVLPAGQTQSIPGAAPFDVTIGNAAEVTLTFRGQAVDLAPYTRGNVARLTLQ